MLDSGSEADRDARWNQSAFRDARRLHLGSRFEVTRAIRQADGLPVVLKAARQDRPRADSETRLRREFELLRRLERLEIDGIERVLGLAEVAGSTVLVLEDAGRESLADRLQGGPLATEAFLDLAVKMARIVGAVHAHNLIHRDVCPSNFVLSGDRLTLVDFEAATSVSGFAQTAAGPGDLEGTLAYLAPEQTGRVRHLVDHRADLYALGCVFYEMLTGAPPFVATDPLELLHFQIARAPVSPAIINPAVAVPVSNLVLMLLAKTPGWRYQTTEALVADLEEALRQWRSRGAITDLEPGTRDVPHGLFLAGRLYGRDRDAAALDQAFERARAGGREVFLVTGRAGVGKTALVNELRARVDRRCRWLHGKCELLRGNVPYAPVASALATFVSSLLDDPDVDLEPLRARLVAAIGPNGRVLTEAIPPLERLIGAQPPVAAVGAAEAENRFHWTFAALVRALGGSGCPTVFFLDDLQWVDAASLKLLRTLAADPDIGALLVLGVYRTEEVGSGHAVVQATQAIRETGTPLAVLELEPLDQTALLALLCDSLRVRPEEALPLAEIALRKTAGNPFFVRRFFGFLHREGLLVLDAERGVWRWDLQEIARANVAENVIALAAASLDRLPSATCKTLEAAACIGGAFDLALLAAVVGQPVEEVARTLWAPLEEGLVVPAFGSRFARAAADSVELRSGLAAAYRFGHDRIQQVAYQRLGDDERAVLHLTVGRQLLAWATASHDDEAAFEIVDQLDRAVSRLSEPERRWLAELNARAGGRARDNAAFASALAYFRQGLELLPREPWRVAHDLWFPLTRDAAACAMLTGEAAAAERLAGEGLEHATTILEKAELYNIAVVANTLSGKHDRAIERGKEGLHLLGIDVLGTAALDAVAAEKARTRAVLESRKRQGGGSLAVLLDTPLVMDPEERARHQLMTSLTAPAWYTSDERFKLLSLRLMQLTVERGHTEDSPMAYVCYAVCLALEGEYAEAYEVGLLGLRLAERLANPVQETRVLSILGGHVGPWRVPLRETLVLLRRAVEIGPRSGDLQFSTIAAEDIIYLLLTLGVELHEVISETETVIAHCKRSGQLWDVPHMVVTRQAARCLKGFTRSSRSFDDDGFEEAAFLASVAGVPTAQALFHHYRLRVGFVLGDLETARASALAAAPLLPVMRSLLVLGDHVFYTGLLCARMCEEASPAQRDPFATELRGAIVRLGRWAENAPTNWEHKRDLAAAELERIEGRPEQALALYARAIEATRREKLPCDEALAHELCGRFHAGRGEPGMAALHLEAAVAAYARWGALAKVQQLRTEWSLQERSLRAATFVPSPYALDYASLLKAIETLTGELVPARLFAKMVSLCGEAAGAERTVLVLDGDTLTVRAVADVRGEVTLERTPLAASRAVPASVVEYVHRSGETIVLGHAAREGRFTGDPYVAAHQTHSLLAVPVRRGDRALGVLYFENDLLAQAFTADRVQMIRMLSAGVGISIENSLLFEERSHIEAMARVLADAGAALSESLDHETTVARVARLLVPALADWCTVDLLEDGKVIPSAWAHADPEQAPLVASLRARYPVALDSPQPAAQAMRAGKALLFTELTDEDLPAICHDVEHLRLVRALRPRSGMAIPLLFGGTIVGVLTLASGERSRYRSRDLTLAEELAHRIALAIGNARLYREAQRAIGRRDEFLSIASHELRTPVTALRITIQGLLGGQISDSPDHLPKMLQLAERQTVKMARLIDEMLSVSRIQSGGIELLTEPVDLVMVVRDVKHGLGGEIARAHCSLTVEAPAPVIGRWDRNRLEQVVANLLSNALKFGAAKPISVTVTEQDGNARLVVRDHGIGIAPERLPNIFDRFERAVSARHYGGLGLGLYVVRTIVLAHGGTVRADSEVDVGSTFTVELPCAGPDSDVQ